MKIEAFAIAGCVLNLLRTSKQQADFLKREIRDLMKAKLVEATGDENAEMEYVQYEEKIVHGRGFKLIGWTAPHLVNPSELSSSLAPLKQLVHALKTNACRFVKLTPTERQERIDRYNEEVAAGQREPFQNHRQSDAASGKRKRRERAVNGAVREEDREDQGPNEEPNEVDVENGEDGAKASDPRPTKRRKTVPKRVGAPLTTSMTANVAAAEVLPPPRQKKSATRKALAKEATTRYRM
ncbi:hypothetical protein B0H10DRAFT_2233197 [Mycena sp. CBHHK59/15]|nr:hypothetical protein B0H10DRAFT_2233197 [Mycena sp. CBHHK59/15]